MPNHCAAGPLRVAVTLAVHVATMTWVGGAGTAAQVAAQGPLGNVAPATKARSPKTVRLYVFDCGLLNITTEGVERYHVTPVEVGETRMSVPCFLVVHPRGTLLWDVGVIPDGTVEGKAQGGRSNVNPT